MYANGCIRVLSHTVLYSTVLCVFNDVVSVLTSRTVADIKYFILSFMTDYFVCFCFCF